MGNNRDDNLVFGKVEEGSELEAEVVSFVNDAEIRSAAFEANRRDRSRVNIIPGDYSASADYGS
jgi:hypothetical protein